MNTEALEAIEKHISDEIDAEMRKPRDRRDDYYLMQLIARHLEVQKQLDRKKQNK